MSYESQIMKQQDGRTTIFHGDPYNPEKHIIETVMDIEGSLEHNQWVRNAFDERARWKDVNQVASIPFVILANHPELDHSRPEFDEAALRRWLNDKDNVMFRTRPGRV